MYATINNKDYCQSLYHKPTAEFNNKILQALREAVSSELITEEVARQPENIYFLYFPKIHKKYNPGRPIVNIIDSKTEHLSVYVDDNIKHSSKLVPS